MAVNRDEFLRKQNRIAILLKRFAITLALDLGCSIEHSLHCPELNDQLDASLVTNARSPGNVVDRVPSQRHHIHHLLWRYAKRLDDLGWIENEVVLLRIENFYMRCDELHHVFVARDDENLMLTLGSLASKRANHVIGLKADRFDDGDT